MSSDVYSCRSRFLLALAVRKQKLLVPCRVPAPTVSRDHTFHPTRSSFKFQAGSCLGEKQCTLERNLPRAKETSKSLRSGTKLEKEVGHVCIKIYTCVCMCVYIYICIYIYIYIYIHIHIMCVCMHACMYVCICMYVCMYMYVCVYIYIYMSAKDRLGRRGHRDPEALRPLHLLRVLRTEWSPGQLLLCLGCSLLSLVLL